MANNKYLDPSQLNKGDRKARSLGAGMRQKNFGAASPKCLAPAMKQKTMKAGGIPAGRVFVGRRMEQGGGGGGRKKK